jgi:hypothetical protein
VTCKCVSAATLVMKASGAKQYLPHSFFGGSKPWKGKPVTAPGASGRSSQCRKMTTAEQQHVILPVNRRHSRSSDCPLRGRFGHLYRQTNDLVFGSIAEVYRQAGSNGLALVQAECHLLS